MDKNNVKISEDEDQDFRVVCQCVLYSLHKTNIDAVIIFGTYEITIRFRHLKSLSLEVV